MKEFEIYISDYQRIIFGEVPWAFFLELILRSILFYAVLILSMRAMGTRMAAQLSRIEMAAMVSLAAAIGVPLQSPERGILPAIVIAIVVVLLERLISYLASKNQRFEDLSQDDLDILVEDSVLKLEMMERTRISKDRLCAHLRGSGLKHLGWVRRMYLEADGHFTVIKFDVPAPGLPILPDWDKDFLEELKVTDRKVCTICGSGQTNSPSCSNCGGSNWTNGVLD